METQEEFIERLMEDEENEFGVYITDGIVFMLQYMATLPKEKSQIKMEDENER